MDVAAYAAVSEAVDLAPKRARGIVNAVLRRAAEGKAPEPRDLATRTAHPQWLLDRWTRMYGAERASRIAGSDASGTRPTTIGSFRMRGTSRSWCAALRIAERSIVRLGCPGNIWCAQRATRP